MNFPGATLPGLSGVAAESSGFLFFFFRCVSKLPRRGISLIQQRFFFDASVTLKKPRRSQWSLLNFA
jgi:hypothetical protein